ncbi:MAG: hypothetical protein JWR18_1186 [Segetibacter sp.]|jgi:hypothetical protein|nr:hypothetical protein [Segetibacter sp.]
MRSNDFGEEFNQLPLLNTEMKETNTRLTRSFPFPFVLSQPQKYKSDFCTAKTHLIRSKKYHMFM